MKSIKYYEKLIKIRIYLVKNFVFKEKMHIYINDSYTIPSNCKNVRIYLYMFLFMYLLSMYKN